VASVPLRAGIEPAPTAMAGGRVSIPLLAFAALAAVYLFFFVRVLTWNPDGGIYIYGAQMVLRGAIPARDFVELQGPGSFYWLAMFFKFFGVSFLTARAVLLVTGTATATLLFYLGQRIGGTGISAALVVLVTSIPLGVMTSPHYDSNLFALAAFAIFVHGAEGIHRRWSFLTAGALAGATSCFLQQKGFYLACAFVLTLFILHRARARGAAMLVGLGFSGVIAAELLLYTWAHALRYLVYANLIWPLSTYEKANSAPYGFILREGFWRSWYPALHAIFPGPVALGLVFIFSVPFLLILGLPAILPLLAYRWRTDASERRLIPYWAAGIAIWASELHRWDLGHLRNGCVLLLVVSFALLERRKRAVGKYVAAGITGCAVLYGTVNVAAASGQRVPIQSRRGTLYGSTTDPVLEFLQTHTTRGEEVFVYPYQPIYYFAADVRNPTRYSNLMYGINTDAQFHEAVEDIERKRVRYVLWDTVFSGEGLRNLFPAYRPPAKDKLIMEPYLERNYRQIGFENGFRILERKR